MNNLIYLVIQGLMAGGFYAMLAAGLSVAFGVMKVVNLAHGDIVVLAAFVALLLLDLMSHSLGPVWSLVLCIPIMSVLGYAFQRYVLNKTIGTQLLPPLLVTFGLSVILQNGMLSLFTADSRRLSVGELDGMSYAISDSIHVGVLPLLVLIAALILFLSLHFLIKQTKLGRALRAAADDPHTLAQMGSDPKHVYALAAAVSFAICAIAAIAYGMTSQFTPLSGPPRLLIAFEAVVIGGVGSLAGTLCGALLLGVVQSIGGSFDPSLQQFSGHVLFLVTLLLRPQGLFARGH